MSSGPSTCTEHFIPIYRCKMVDRSQQGAQEGCLALPREFVTHGSLIIAFLLIRDGNAPPVYMVTGSSFSRASLASGDREYFRGPLRF